MAQTKAQTAEKPIILGSGRIYLSEWTGEVPADLASHVASQPAVFGRVQGGASLEYKPEYVTETDDEGIVTKTVITKEEAILKSGLCTVDADTIAKTCPTARITETETDRTVKIGGVKNDNGKSYLIVFAHKDPVDSDIYIAIKGKNGAGLTFNFAKDKATVPDIEFKAEPNDSEGTLVVYQEVFKKPKTSEPGAPGHADASAETQGDTTVETQDEKVN